MITAKMQMLPFSQLFFGCILEALLKISDTFILCHFSNKCQEWNITNLLATVTLT